MTLLRELALLLVAAALTWWFLLCPPNEPPATAPPTAEPTRDTTAPVFLTPLLAAAPATPPPPEAGTPDGRDTPTPTSPVPAPEPEPDDAPAPPPAPAPAPAPDPTPEAPDPEPEPAPTETLMADETLLTAASTELADSTRQGFATVLLAAPEDQLAIARFFGEELVLVPRAVLDPEAPDPRYFRVAADGRVETVRARPPLERFRQYRDLFDYEYARLPRPLRELRKSVLARNEVFVFAALIPVREWAVVVGRRRDALALTGRPLADVRRFLLRYERRPRGGFDLVVEEIVFADGERFRPSLAAEGI